MSVLIAGILIGLVAGYLTGVRRAEYGIARASGKRAMTGRSDWRK